MNCQLLLASASPYRHKVLTQTGIPFRSIPTHIPERDMGQAPLQHIQRLAAAKAEASVEIIPAVPKAYVLGLDTMIIHQGKAIGKPACRAEAGEILASLQGSKHIVATGYALLHIEWGKIKQKKVMVCTTQITFRRLSRAWQEWYLSQNEWKGKSGGYAVQGLAMLLIERVEGDVGNAVGLSIPVFLSLSEEMGVTWHPVPPPQT